MVLHSSKHRISQDQSGSNVTIVLCIVRSEIISNVLHSVYIHHIVLLAITTTVPTACACQSRAACTEVVRRPGGNMPERVTHYAYF